MHPHIKNILENYTYPTIKSIAYPNGDMLVLEGQWLGEEYHLRILCQSTLDSYFKEVNVVGKEMVLFTLFIKRVANFYGFCF